MPDTFGIEAAANGVFVETRDIAQTNDTYNIYFKSLNFKNTGTETLYAFEPNQRGQWKEPIEVFDILVPLTGDLYKASENIHGFIKVSSDPNKKFVTLSSVRRNGMPVGFIIAPSGTIPNSPPGYTPIPQQKPPIPYPLHIPDDKKDVIKRQIRWGSAPDLSDNFYAIENVFGDSLYYSVETTKYRILYLLRPLLPDRVLQSSQKENDNGDDEEDRSFNAPTWGVGFPVLGGGLISFHLEIGFISHS